MLAALDLSLRRPNGSTSIAVIYSKAGNNLDLLMSIYKNMLRLITHEQKNDLQKEPGLYKLSISGLDELGLGTTMHFQQNVNDQITYDGMLSSLTNAIIFDTVGRLYNQGDKRGQKRSGDDCKQDSRGCECEQGCPCVNSETEERCPRSSDKKS